MSQILRVDLLHRLDLYGVGVAAAAVGLFAGSENSCMDRASASDIILNSGRIVRKECTVLPDSS